METSSILYGLIGIVCGFGSILVVLMIRGTRALESLDESIRQYLQQMGAK